MSNDETNPNVNEETVEQDAPVSENETETTAEVEIESDESSVDARIEELQAQLAEAKEQALRTAAEAQNIRRRAEQDVEKAHKFALEKFVNDMLPVADNLERAVDAASAENATIEAVVEGVELTLKTLIDGLARHKVEQLDPQGEPFDPQFHQAMTMVPDPNVEPNSVLNVFQKGYTLSGRLVRPAMVVVSKAQD